MIAKSVNEVKEVVGCAKGEGEFDAWSGGLGVNGGRGKEERTGQRDRKSSRDLADQVDRPWKKNSSPLFDELSVLECLLCVVRTLLNEVLSHLDQMTLPEGWESVRRSRRFHRPLFAMGIHGIPQCVQRRVFDFKTMERGSNTSTTVCGR